MDNTTYYRVIPVVSGEAALSPFVMHATSSRAFRRDNPKNEADDRVKILHIITRGEIGGAQIVVRELARYMPSGYAPMVAAGERGFLEDECKRYGIPFHYVPGLVRNIYPFRDITALFRVMGLIRREKVDIVHAHTSKAGVIGRLAAWLTRTPCVFTAHTWSFDDGISLVQRLVAVPIERLVALISGPIIVVSEANRRKAMRQKIAPPETITRVWLGIPDVPERAEPASTAKVRLIMTARFVAQKDQPTLLRALAHVKGPWELTLVGDGPLVAESRALVAANGLEDRVKFLGNRSDVAALLADSDVFLLSTHWEGLPVSILEAMRAGLPVVATNVGGISEMVNDEVTGFVTRVEDEHGLAARIQQLVDSPQLRATMGASGRSRYEADFQIDGCIQKHVDIYRKMIADKGTEPVLSAEVAG